MSGRARLEITINIGQTIRRLGHIRIRIQGKNFEMFYIVGVACSIYLTISSDEGSINITDTF